MKILYLLIISVWWPCSSQLQTVLPKLTPYKVLHKILIESSSQDCHCSNQLAEYHSCFFWLEKAFESNNESLLFLLLNHPYQRKFSQNICTGFNPFIHTIYKDALTLNAIERELLKPYHSELAITTLKLWTSDTKNNPFLKEWRLLFARWKFQLQLLKCLEMIPFGNDTTTPFLKSHDDQRYQWMFLLRCYWTFLTYSPNYLSNMINKSYQRNERLWKFKKEYINKLITMPPVTINNLAINIKDTVKLHYNKIFDEDPQTNHDQLVLRGQSQSILYAETLINALVKLHS